MEKINKLDDMVHAVFKLKKRNSRRTILLVSAEKRAAPLLTLKNNRMRLVLAAGKDPLKNPANHQALISGLLLSSGALDLNDRAEQAVPRWICAGLEDRQNSFQHAERYLKGLRNISIAEIMFNAGIMPDLSKLPHMPAKLDNEAAFWYGQFCRFLLETAIDQKLLQPYGARLLQTQSYEDEHAQLLQKLAVVIFDQKQKSQRFIANRILWNSYHPEPAEVKIKKWKKILQWQIPELDRQGKITDRKKSLPLADLHLHLKNHPEAAEQRKLASDMIRDFRIGCTFQESSILHRIYMMLKNPAGNDREERTQKLNAQIDTLSNIFQKRKNLENFLYSAERISVSAARSFQRTLKVDSEHDKTATEKQIRFLLDTEKLYAY